MDSVQHAPLMSSPARSTQAISAYGRALPGLGLVLVLGLASCASSGPGKATLETRSHAEHATRSGDWRAAADHWYAIFLDGGCVEVEPCVETARALIELGDPESASSIVKLGLDNNPNEPALLEMEAEALVASGFRRSAERSYERALAGNPDSPTCLLGVARQRMALGKESLAVRPLERLIAMQPEHYEALTLLARARTAAGDSPGAFSAWTAAFQIDRGRDTLTPQAIADRLEAGMLFMESDVQAAYPHAGETCGRWLARVLEDDPQCTRAHFELGVLYERVGRLDLAVEAYRRAVETDPACLMALTNLALLHSVRGEVEQTQALVDRALSLEPDEGRRRALKQLAEDCARKASQASPR